MSYSWQQQATVFIPADPALEEVFQYLQSRYDLVGTVGRALRKSFDEVIDGPRTGRFCIEELEKTEKTYIGTKVEIVLRAELELGRGEHLDNLICGHEVDTKFSLTGAWMIPREAVGHLCLLVRGDDNRQTCAAGLLRMTPEVLTVGSNQDGKRSISAVGKHQIRWLFDAPMPPNFLLSLPPSIRYRIMSQPSGMQRVAELFTNVIGQIIPRTAIEQVAQQKDPLRRARQMKERLEGLGFKVLCAKYDEDRREFLRYGFDQFENDDWLSLRMY